MSIENLNTLHDYQLNVFAKLVKALGKDNIEKLIADVEADTKYGNKTVGNFEAFMNKIGGENIFDKILSDELKFSITEDAAKIIATVKKLFDKNGRRIPLNLKAAVCDPDKNYYVTQPVIDYKDRMIKGFEGTGLNAFMSLADFAGDANKLIEKLKADEQLKHLFKGVYLPIIIPKTQLTDLGEMTEELVTAAGKSYQKLFSKRSFTNYRKGELKEQVTIVNGSRYEQLVEKIKQQSVVAVYFPTALQGFSVHADIEQMATLPENAILSGPLDVAMAFTMYPDVLGRDNKTPVYDCAAVNWQSSGLSLFFIADDGKASFDNGSDLSDACGGYAGGVVVLGY